MYSDSKKDNNTASKHAGFNTRRVYVGLGLGFSALLTVWFLIICTQQCISYDNAYQYFLNQHSWGDMFSLILVDYSPPLYSIVMKLYSLVFGTGLMAVRVLSLLILCIPFFLALFPLRRLMGKECALLACVLFMASSYNFYFGVSLRPTILAYALTTGMFIYAMLTYFGDKKSDLIAFSVFAILSMYTHNVSLITAFCIYAATIIIALIEKNWVVFKKFLISGIIVAVLYTPWLYVLITQTGNVSDHFWVSNDTLPYGLYLAFAAFVGNLEYTWLALPAAAFVLFLPLINYLLLVKKERFKTSGSIKDLVTPAELKAGFRNVRKLLYLMLVMVLAVTAFYLVTEFVAPIFARRYFFIYSGGGIIFVSGLATMCRNKKAPAVILAAMMAFTLVFNTIAERNIINRSDRERMIAEINSMTEGKPRFLDLYEETLGVTTFYFPDATHYVTDDTFSVLPNFDVFSTDTVYLHNGDDVWEYTDEVYIFSSFDFELYGLDPYDYYYWYFATPEDTLIEKVGTYLLPYTNEIGYGTYNITLYRVSYTNS